MKKEKELVKNTVIIFIGKISTQIISFLMLPLYTAYLKTAEYGYVDLIHTYIQLLGPIICLGLQNAAFRFLVDSRSDRKKREAIISNIFISSIILFIVFLMLYIIVNMFLHINYTFYIIINTASFLFLDICLQIARGVGDNKTFAIASGLTTLMTVLLNVVLIMFLKFGAIGMLISMFAANLVGAIYIVLKLKLYKYINIHSCDKEILKELLKYSLPTVPSGISWWIISASDRTIISTAIGVAANGIYAIACKFPNILNVFTNIFALSWTESAAINIESDKRDIFFSKVIDNAIRIFSSLCIGMIACMPFVFPILIDSQYNEAYMYIPILVLASLCNVFVSIYSAIYVAKKLTKQVANTSIVAAIINISINLLFVKFIGIYAAAISTVFAYGIMMVYRHFDLKKFIHLKIDFKLLGLLIAVFTIVTTTYYINNFVLNAIMLVLIVLFTAYLNRKIVLKTLNFAKQKLKIG